MSQSYKKVKNETQGRLGIKAVFSPKLAYSNDLLHNFAIGDSNRLLPPGGDGP